MPFPPLFVFPYFLDCRLLYSVLPPSVANELRHQRPVSAKRYDNVTILFSGILGFNAFCSKHASAEGAIKIVNLLNDVYTRFDILTDSRKNPYVYKVGSFSFQDTSNLHSRQLLLCCLLIFNIRYPFNEKLLKSMTQTPLGLIRMALPFNYSLILSEGGIL